MDWTNFVTYGDSYQEAFETLCTQLFERYLKRTYEDDLVKFRVINGAGGDGGDGGIEAYGEMKNGGIIAVQAKWFRDVIEKNEIEQIKDSVETALSLRKNIKEYIYRSTGKPALRESAQRSELIRYVPYLSIV